MEQAFIALVSLIFSPNGIVLISIILLAKPIGNLITRIVTIKYGSASIGAELKDVKNVVREEAAAGAAAATREVLTELHYGTYHTNSEAFDKAGKWVTEYLDKHPAKDPVVDIKMTVVSMAFSWNALILQNVPVWLRAHPTCTIKLSILLTNPDYLESLPIENFPIDWAQTSRGRKKDVEKMMDSLPKPHKSRLSCMMKFYNAVPQYHGIVINEEQLYLGRTGWSFEQCPETKPVLSVGQERYRYFDKKVILRDAKGEDRGSERVGLFLDWHRYYSIYNSTRVIEYEYGVKTFPMEHTEDPNMLATVATTPSDQVS